VAEGYRYTGGDRRGYLAYVDDDTGQLLVVEPGETYRMRAINHGDPVPPADDRWDVPDDADETSPPPAADDATETGDGTETEDEK
jgi:hypothetical protein